MILEVAVVLWFVHPPSQDHSEYLGNDDDSYWEETEAMKDEEWVTIHEFWQRLPDGSYRFERRTKDGLLINSELYTADAAKMVAPEGALEQEKKEE